jgi:hypothetical protein
MTTIITNHLTDTVDHLGVIKARIAELQTEHDRLRDILVENGPGAYEGEFFRATVSESERHTLDMDAVREKLGPKWCEKHTNVTEFPRVCVTARSGKAITA